MRWDVAPCPVAAGVVAMNTEKSVYCSDKDQGDAITGSAMGREYCILYSLLYTVQGTVVLYRVQNNKRRRGPRGGFYGKFKFWETSAKIWLLKIK